MLDGLALHDGERIGGDGDTGRLALALLSRSETGLLALDGSGRVALANEAASLLLGLREARPGWPGGGLTAAAGSLGDAGRQALAAWQAEGGLGVAWVPRADGRMLTVSGAPGPDGHLLVTVAPASRGAVPVERCDPLTGLADRAWFLDRLTAMLAETAGEVAVLMVDLDRFKAVNDTLGHQVGDALLRVVGMRLSAALRQGDLVCRYAGDEFAVALPRASDAAAVGRRLVGLLSRPYQIEGATVTIGASVGVALGPEHGDGAAALLRSADVALYDVKGNGRGATRVFDAALEADSRKRSALAAALRRAVPAGELELHFQPQMSLATRGLTGLEALVRWRHPVFGLLGPNEFIPLAEETGLIWMVGEWVLRQACAQATLWPPHLSVCVNISAQQTRDRTRLARTIKSILLQTGLAPGRLVIEITEASMMREDETLPVLDAVHALGVRISLDDFGTGSSSLRQLRRFPLDQLKIDGSFIQALGTTAAASDVVRAIASLGRSLGLTVIAEGVETADQQDRLQVDGCSEIQGFYLSQPVRASEVHGLIGTLGAGATGVDGAGAPV